MTDRERFVAVAKGTCREHRWADRERWRPLAVDEMRDRLPADVEAAFRAAMGKDPYGGHGGSHAFLVHEFVSANAAGRRPAVNAWEAARYMAAGCAAERSARRDGELVDVPDWGDAPV